MKTIAWKESVDCRFVLTPSTTIILAEGVERKIYFRLFRKDTEYIMIKNINYACSCAIGDIMSARRIPCVYNIHDLIKLPDLKRS